MKPRTSIIWIVLFFLFIKGIPAFSQQIIFNKVLPAEGITFGMVTDITQDINGSMWFSTKNGLYRYDGYQMTNYRKERMNHNSIGDNNLESVLADSNGIVWVGTLGAGLDRFDPENGVFTHFRHNKNDTNSISNDTVTAILRDKKGILWIGTHGGLDKFDHKTNKFIHYRYNAKDITSISNNQVRVIYEDRQGTLWIGTGSAFPDNGGGPKDGGLNRLNKKTGTFTRYQHNANNIRSLANNKVSAIYEDTQGIFWIGTAGNGLHKMDRQQGTFERIVHDPAHPEKLSGPPLTKESPANEQITFITQDAAGSYWIGSFEGGLNYYNPKLGKTIHYNAKENKPEGFNESGTWFAFTSRDGVLWISSNGNGNNLYRIDPFHKEMEHTKSGWISSFYEEPDGIFWIGEDIPIRIDRGKGITKRYEIINYASASEWVRIIKQDRKGNLWIGTSAGLKLWNEEKEFFNTYKHDPGNSSSLSNNIVHTIFEDRDSNLWIGTAMGFNFRNSKTGSITQYFINPNDTTEWGENCVTALLQDKTGKVWIGTWFGEQGVYLFNRENKIFKNYLKGTNISCLFEDEDGVLWVGGSDGLYKFDHNTDAFILYTDTSSFIEIPDVSRMVEDDQKYLWLQTTLGMMRLNPQRNETVNFGISRTNLDFNSNCYKGRDGKLYFTEPGGYYSFYPADFTQNIKPPEIIFTSFRLANKLIKPGNGSPLKESLSHATEIRLRYNQNIFSFDFAAIDYANPEGNRHFFMLENYDDSWRPAGSELKAYYFNIPPGKYVFRVKASNSKGAWAEKNINIVILPPWWSTWWAYCLYGLLLTTVVIAAFGFQKRLIVMAERQKTQIRELAHAQEIEKAYTELKTTQVQLIQSEKMASLGELTAGIAHEIQNPLNFVNNFSEVNSELLGEMKNELQTGKLNEAITLSDEVIQNNEKIVSHGKRADAIVKGMLQHSRSSSGIKEPTDINALADEYFRLSYHGMKAKDKSFHATMKSAFDPSIGKINVIPQDIGRVILNLINNAFYAVAEKKKTPRHSTAGIEYEPTVTVTTSKIGDKIQLSVKDNGMGIQQKNLEKIFQPFFTTKPAGQGMGLGLSLSYDIIKAHGGEIKVETEEGKFTEFIILLNSIS
jgi:signal transduction histidine kinase/ligand-binding sensor domain-containing protein